MTRRTLRDGTPLSVARRGCIVSWGPGLRIRIDDCHCDLMSQYARSVLQLITVLGTDQASEFERCIVSSNTSLIATHEDRLLWRSPKNIDIANYLNNKYLIDTWREGFLVGGAFKECDEARMEMFVSEYKTIVSITRKLVKDFRLPDLRIDDIWVSQPIHAQWEHIQNMKHFYSSRTGVRPLGDASSLLADAIVYCDEDSVSSAIEEPRLSSPFSTIDL